jgi:hypothetical protein
VNQNNEVAARNVPAAESLRLMQQIEAKVFPVGSKRNMLLHAEDIEWEGNVFTVWTFPVGE